MTLLIGLLSLPVMRAEYEKHVVLYIAKERSLEASIRVIVQAKVVETTISYVCSMVGRPESLVE